MKLVADTFKKYRITVRYQVLYNIRIKIEKDLERQSFIQIIDMQERIMSVIDDHIMEVLWFDIRCQERLSRFIKDMDLTWL